MHGVLRVLPFLFVYHLGLDLKFIHNSVVLTVTGLSLGSQPPRLKLQQILCPFGRVFKQNSLMQQITIGMSKNHQLKMKIIATKRKKNENPV